MDYTVIAERRSDARFGGAVLGSVSATLRPGCMVALIDLSAGGALVEARRPLRPGARVQLQFHRGPRRLAIAGEVLRCAVWALDADGGIVYRGALQFDARCEALWETETLADGRDGDPASAGPRAETDRGLGPGGR